MANPVALPGTVVSSGAAVSPGGAQGVTGTPAWTTNTSGFTIPNVGSTVSVTVADASWIVVGEMLYVDQAGGGVGLSGVLQVQSKSGNVLTLLNPQPAPAIPLADNTQNGLLKQVSNSALDYVGGDNACHAMASVVIPQCGRLILGAASPATSLKFVPYLGDQIKISGLLYSIPAAGITSLATSVYVNGVAGQNLAASTFYYVYLFNNAGTLTFDFSTTAHATSATAGNVGVEIKSGDDTRSLIGIIYTGTSSPFFYDQPATRYLRSWFNRARVYLDSGSASWGPTSSTSFVSTGQSIKWIAFTDEPMFLTASGNNSNSAVPNTNTLQMALDGTQIGSLSAMGFANVGYQGPISTSVSVSPSEGVLHTMVLMCKTSGGGMSGASTVVGTLG